MDIPGLIHNEVSEAMKEFKAKDSIQVDAITQDDSQKVNIPALIKEEVRLAMKEIKKPEEENVDEEAGVPEIGEPVKNKKK